MENSDIFSTRLKELRGKIPQGQLGEILGVSRGSVSFYENGERTPDADFIIKAARHFDVSTDYLLGLSEYKNQDEIDSLIKKMHELDGLSIKQKSLLLYSLGFVSERLKYINDPSLKEKIISWLAELLQSFANMIYLPEKIKKIKPGIVEMDQGTLAFLTSPHRDAISVLNRLDDAIINKFFKRHMSKQKEQS